MVECVIIENENGVIRGTLTEPLGPTEALLVCLHGGPGGNEHGNTGGYDHIAEMAAGIGYATLQFSFYGNGDSDGGPEDYSISSQMIDYDSAVKFMKDRFEAPVHVVGESAGATIAALKWREDIASYVLLWPAFDLLDTDFRALISRAALDTLVVDEVYEMEGVKLGRALAYEVLTYDFSACFDLPKKPIFLAHGKSDTIVSYSQSLRALASAKSQLLFYSHPTADHGFEDPVARRELLSKLRSWLKELKNM